MAETFNAYIINARSKHLIYMLEEIRVSLMKRLVEKKKEMEVSVNVLCPRVQKMLEKEKEKAASCEVFPSENTLFQVQHGIDSLTVDLDKRTCTCRKWDVTGIPCFHGVAAIFHIHAYAEDYVHDQYKREAYLRAYNLSIKPCPGQRHWPKRDLPLCPPPIKIGPGRPRKKRRRDPHEDPKKGGKLTKHGLQMKCSICKSNSHNKRKCPDKDKPQPPPPPPKKPMGRPRKVARTEASSEGQRNSEDHHRAFAQPTRVGRGGRVVMPGRGGRASGRGGRTSGRGRGRTPQGVGVLIDQQGNTYTNVLGSVNGPRNIIPNQQDEISFSQPSTQHSMNQ